MPAETCADPHIAAVVLAAGRSSRMGAHKLLLPLGGSPLVSYAVRAAQDSAAEPIVVVLGHDAERVAGALPPGRHRVVVNDRYREGMATSLRSGLAAIDTPIAGAVVLLADQPLLTAEIVNRVLVDAASHPAAIVAATYAGARGHPVYFPAALFRELAAVEGDAGGRSVITRHADLLRTLAIEPPERGLDVDRPAVYERLVAEWSRYTSTSNG